MKSQEIFKYGEWLIDAFLALNFYLRSMIVIFLLLQLIAWSSTERPKFHYNKKIILFNKLMKQTNLMNL